MDNFSLGLIWYPVFLLSTTLHEASHAYAAMLGGDLTGYHEGQVTLDPRPHIKREPFWDGAGANLHVCDRRVDAGLGECTF